MFLLLITSPTLLPAEAELLNACFAAGLQHLHLRKPVCSVAEVESLLQAIHPDYRPRIVIHDHFALQAAYGLGGIHLNGRHPAPPDGYQGMKSRACHSVAEVAEARGHFAYVLMSPLFDSISKQGYRAAYTPQELEQARAAGIIGPHVVAMGGICRDNLSQVGQWGFGGAAILGDVWGRYHSPADIPSVVHHVEELLALCRKL